MQTVKAITALTIAAAATSSATAQPFVHGIGEREQSLETANDLTLIRSGEIIFVGGIALESNNLQEQGYMVMNDPAGIPMMSWIIDDPETEFAQAFAVRQDLSDDSLIIAQHGEQFATNAPPLGVLYKFDPFGGGLMYQWQYEMSTLYANLGMELAGDFGHIAAGAQNAFGSQDPTLLQFEQATGLPVFHNRYQIFSPSVFDASFVDVYVDEQAQSIYAVGYVGIQDPNFVPGEIKLLIAKFDTAGFPIWFNAYDVPLSDAEAVLLEGTSIELTSIGEVAVTSTIFSPTSNGAVLNAVVDPTNGFPINAMVLEIPGGFIQPAYSSLERQNERGLLVSGTYFSEDLGGSVPAMWALDEANLNVNWFWSPNQTAGQGFSAIPMQLQDPLLAGQVFPLAQQPIGNFDDALLARTDPFGQGLCPLIPNLIEYEVPMIHLPLSVEAITMPLPTRAQLEVITAQPVHIELCEKKPDCPTDVDGDGDTDIEDLLLVLRSFGVNDDGDTDCDGDTDIEDLLAVLREFGKLCP